MSRKQLAEKYIIKQWVCQWLIRNGEHKCFINIPKLATYFQSGENETQLPVMPRHFVLINMPKAFREPKVTLWSCKSM